MARSSVEQPQDAGLTVLEYAQLYLRKGLSVFPLQARSKRPLGEWKAYQAQRPSEQQLEKWFRNRNVNVAIVCGRVSENLVVIDFDNKELFESWVENLPERLRKALAWTWVVETGKGFHVYFRLKEAGWVPRTKPRLKEGLDIKAEGGYVVAPPSIHPSGKPYRFTGNPWVKDIYVLGREEWELLKESLGWREEHAQPRETEARELDLSERLKIIELLKPYYKPGYRDLIVFFLSGWLYKSGIGYSSARAIVEALSEGDEEREQRLYVLDRTYGLKASKPDAEELRGKSGLQEILSEAAGEEKALEIIRQIQEVIGPSPFSGDSVFAIADLERGQYWANNPRRGWIARATRKEGRLVYNKIIVRAAISKLRIIRNPMGGPSTYEITWVTEAGRELVTRGFIYDHIGKLRLEALVASKQLVEDAVSSIITTMERLGRAEVVEELEVEGIYWDGSELKSKPPLGIDLSEFDDRVAKLAVALETLDEVVEKWFSHAKDKASLVVKWSLVAPFHFARKQLAANPIPYLMLIGPGGTGKTTLANLPRYIWKLPQGQYENTGDSLASPARFGYKFSMWTYPIMVNEPAALYDKTEIREMQKNAWDSLIVRGKYKHGEYIEYPSLANMIQVSNEPVDVRMTEAERRRFIILRFTWKERIPRDKEKEFIKTWGRFGSNMLPVLGEMRDWIYDYVRGHPELLRENWVKMAEEILEELYKTAGMDPPSWLSLMPEVEDSDPTAEWRSEVIMAINDYVAEVLNRYARNELLNLPDLESRLAFITENLLPSSIFMVEGKVYILKKFLDYLADRGVRLGSLRDLAELMGWSYMPSTTLRKVGVKAAAVVVNIRELDTYL